jgi:hypothetical protein
MGYIEAEEKKGDTGEIRARQQSCMIKDLPPDEVPEFWKDLIDGKMNMQPKMSTKELMKKVSISERLKLLGYRR